MKKQILMIVSLLLGVQLCLAAGAFAWTPLTGSVSIDRGRVTAYGTDTKFLQELKIGDIITFGTDPTRYVVIGVPSDSQFLCLGPDGSNYLGQNYTGPVYHIAVTSLTGTVTISPGSVFAQGTNTKFLAELNTNDIITFGADPTLYVVLGVLRDTTFGFALASDNTVYSGSKWSGTAYRQDPPGTIRLTGDASIKTGRALAYGNTITKFLSELKTDDIISFGWDQTTYAVVGVPSNRTFVFVDSLNGYIYQGPDYFGVTYVQTGSATGGACIAPWGEQMVDGQQVTAYATSSVACGSTCASETRTCNNGVLSGSYTVQSCTVIPRDGGWSDWTWGACTGACGSLGTQTGTRTCTNPTPGCGGKPCPGSNTMTQFCNMPACGPTWKATTGQGTMVQSCLQWLTQTGQAGTQRRLTDGSGNVIQVNSCAYQLGTDTDPNRACFNGSDILVPTNGWHPTSHCNDGTMIRNTESYR